MKRTSLITVGLLTTLSWPVYAQTVTSTSVATTTPTPLTTQVPLQYGVTHQATTTPGNSSLIHSQRRAAFASQIKQKLDERRQQIALHIVDELNTINANRVQRFTDHLDRLTEIISKIAIYTDTVEKQGINVTTVRTAIATAQTAINNARAAVATQQAKDYQVTLTTNEPVGQAIRTVVQQLRTDLQTLHQSSIAPARQATVAAFQALRAIAPKTSPTPAPVSSTVLPSSPSVSPSTTL